MAQVGDFIDNRYRIVDKIGEGGMSEVWLANDTRLNKMQAVKEIKRNAKTETHKVLAERIKVEADIMRRLEHPNIVKVIDYIDDGSSLYIVMDYIQGRDLLSVLKDRSITITEDNVVDWGIQLCDALGYLHSQDIVYRDMKPGNVMLMDDGTVKIIDFGIAREYSPDKEDDTMPLGTRGYASPEAFKRGAQTDARSDIYSLGVTLFHLVTGHGPMEFVDQPTLPPIREINPALSEGLETVIIKSTQWMAADRYQSCAEMMYDLQHKEDLTVEKRRRLVRIVTLFRAFTIAGAACLVLGIGFLVGSNLVRGSSYDDIMTRAVSASVEEQDGQPSQAESLYTQAIGIMPGEITPYDAILNDVYKADAEFTTSEASRWNSLFDRNRNAISGSEGFAKLCFDAGIDYFTYYAYGDELTRGSQSVTWFDQAIADYDLRTSRNQPCTMTASERSTAQVYRTIGEFSQKLGQVTQEGTEGAAFAEYWDALNQAVADLSNSDAVIVRLRLCDVVFEAINSPNYLNGFNRAGVNEANVDALLQDVYSIARDLGDEAAVSETTAKLRDNIVDNYSSAQANVDTTYHSAGARAESTANSGSSNNSNSTNSTSPNEQGSSR